VRLGDEASSGGRFALGRRMTMSLGYRPFAPFQSGRVDWPRMTRSRGLAFASKTTGLRDPSEINVQTYATRNEAKHPTCVGASGSASVLDRLDALAEVAPSPAMQRSGIKRGEQRAGRGARGRDGQRDRTKTVAVTAAFDPEWLSCRVRHLGPSGREASWRT
jgi:hypothetical protein